MKFFTFKKQRKRAKIAKIILVLLVFLLVIAGTGLWVYYYRQAQKINSGFKSAGDLFKDDVALAGILYSVLNKEEMNFLVLLQNNTELRPTGGFIGSYGVLKMRAGKINDFYIRDIYSLDRQAEGVLNIAPPAPLRKYFNREEWYLRDANWSPNFPITAQRAKTLYAAEGGQEKIDGVIAITPEVVNDLLDITGAVEADGIKYNSENFVDALQYEVEIAYLEEGKPKEERKEVMNEIAQNLKAKLYSLSLRDKIDAALAIKENIYERNVLLYFVDSGLQESLVKRNLAGELLSAEKDYLMVVDANLGSLKSDPAVKREINYTVQNSVGRVDIVYNNTGEADWKTSHYRTYVRVYVPQGAELITCEGAMANDTQKPGECDVYQELGKTAFGAFISVNLQESETLSFVYQLPDYALNDYQLVLQKQPGNEYTDYRIKAGDEVWRGKLDKDKKF